MNFETKQINRDWLIKVFGLNDAGRKINTLLGVSGLVQLVGVEFANKFIERAYACSQDRCVCKLRRGLKVTFYAH
jgi:hypothetical protein